MRGLVRRKNSVDAILLGCVKIRDPKYELEYWNRGKPKDRRWDRKGMFNGRIDTRFAIFLHRLHNIVTISAAFEDRDITHLLVHNHIYLPKKARRATASAFGHDIVFTLSELGTPRRQVGKGW